MKLNEYISIAGRFKRSIRIDKDVDDLSVLEGYVCIPSAKNVIFTMLEQIKHNSHGAFTWTGPYGSGKSSLAVVLNKLISGTPKSRQEAAKLVDKDLSEMVWDVLNPLEKGWKVFSIVGQRSDPIQIIGSYLAQNNIIKQKNLISPLMKF